MTATGTVNILAAVQGLPEGALQIAIPVSLAAALGVEDTTTLSTGANTITVPTGATFLLFVPPSANTQTITLKGVTGDIGVGLSKTIASLIAVTSSSIVLTVGAQIVGCRLIWL